MEQFSIYKTKNYYRTYFVDDNKRPLIFICAGGAYQYTSPREQEPIMKIFFEKGYHVCIVNYMEDKSVYPTPGMNVVYAFNKMKLDKRVSKIIGVGFSAGAHVLLDITFKNGFYNVCKPDLLIIGYPVITTDPKYSHKVSFQNLLGSSYNDPKLMEEVSLEKKVGNNEPDMFLWGTITDESVDVNNSLLLIKAYHEHKLNLEYHLFPMGGHGLSCANETAFEKGSEKIIPYVEDWASYALKWLDYKLKND